MMLKRLPFPKDVLLHKELHQCCPLTPSSQWGFKFNAITDTTLKAWGIVQWWCRCCLSLVLTPCLAIRVTFNCSQQHTCAMTNPILSARLGGMLIKDRTRQQTGLLNLTRHPTHSDLFPLKKYNMKVWDHTFSVIREPQQAPCSLMLQFTQQHQIWLKCWMKRRRLQGL